MVRWARSVLHAGRLVGMLHLRDITSWLNMQVKRARVDNEETNGNNLHLMLAGHRYQRRLRVQAGVLIAGTVGNLALLLTLPSLVHAWKYETRSSGQWIHDDDYTAGIFGSQEPPCLSLYQPTHRHHLIADQPDIVDTYSDFGWQMLPLTDAICFW